MRPALTHEPTHRGVFLVIDAALARISAAVATPDRVISQRLIEDGARRASALARMAADVLDAAGVDARGLAAVGVTVGPGSFTGLRAAIALAQGVALGGGVPAVGVTLAEVFAQALPNLGRRCLWTAIDSHRGHVFLHRGDAFGTSTLADLPWPDRPVAVAGDAAIGVAAALAARGADVMLTDARLPFPRQIARAVAVKLAASAHPAAPSPLYVDAPHVRAPANGLRPPPT